MQRFIILLGLICLATSVNAQDTIPKKTYHIKRTNTPPKIDAILDDAVWDDAEVATDFIEFRPSIGDKAPEFQRTEVKMSYDDSGIYIAAYMYDNPDNIMRQYTSRDNFGLNDFFIIVFNTNNDAQNDIEFLVFPNGNQADAIANPSSGEDFGWNAVWESNAKVVDDGWVAEIKIPYAALRFAKQDQPVWGLQFHRQHRKTRVQRSWNAINPQQGNIGLYHGELIGLNNIEPPTRLSFFPFASTVINTFENPEFNYGMDVKYGISENFTLDATLIPDFSQAGFDNLTLNLGPFEQTFSEQRQFFAEGVDLFSKGGLFFSRRIGNAPIGNANANLNANETVIDNPNKVNMLNAIKVSGRTKGGLGIGVFNAVTEKTEATIVNQVTGQVRKEVVEPLANYNILVLDQQFNGNSSVTLINTNVTRDGHFRDANVTGLLANIANKRNTYSINGQVKMSNRNLAEGTETGLNTLLSIGKTHGKFRYSAYHTFADEEFDINDLGLNFRNNFNNFGMDASYQIFEPTEKLNNFRINAWYNYRRLYRPSTFAGQNFGANVSGVIKKSLMGFGGNFNFQPGKQYDFFEPRDFANKRFFIVENALNAGGWISSDYNKTFAYDINAGVETYFEKGRDYFSYWFGLSPRVRFNEKFILIYNFDTDIENKERGYANNSNSLGDAIVFGQRDQISVTNSISGNYNFNSFHALNLTLRHYWTTVDYEDDVYLLLDNGRLFKTPNTFDSLGLANSNVNFSTWNFDLSYSWQFAPGSFATALYRNSLFNQTDLSQDNFTDSIDNLFNNKLNNTFSLRLVYFIDYNNAKQWFQKKHS